MKYNIENVKEEDIVAAIKYNGTFREIQRTVEIIKRIESEAYPSKDPMWNKANICLYVYQLGAMQGKREERARRKGGNKQC